VASPARVRRPSHIRPRRKRTPTVLLSALIALGLVLVTGANAHAQVAPSASDIEKQIAALWAKAEPQIEKYNKIHEQFKKNKAKQAALEKKIDPLARQLDLAQIRIGVISAKIYKSGDASAFNALISNGSPSTFADQLTMLDQVARDQQRQLSGVTDLKAKFDTQRAPIDQLVASLATQDRDLAAQKKTIEKQLAKLQDLRRQAYGGTGSTGEFRPWPCPSEYLPTAGYKAAKFACGEAGKDYVWAAEGPDNYDCSGLTLAAWKKVGIYLPHNAAEQQNSMPSVSRANLEIGDLVFFNDYGDGPGHVAIYVGDDKIMHAPSAGDVVRMADINNVGDIAGYGRPNG
jgi:hypothetical protein